MSTNRSLSELPAGKDARSVDSSAAEDGNDFTSDAILPQLTELLFATASLEDFLTDLAKLATETFTSATSCGITLRRDRRPLTVCSSDALAMAVDELQYERKSGPCLQAMETGTIVFVSDTRTETRWGGYPAHALQFGVMSSLSLPLTAGGRNVGAMNLYNGQANAFDHHDVTAGLKLAARADAVLGIALRLGEQVVLTDQLRQAMENRSVIDQAIGVLIGQQRCGANAAFDLLRSASSHRNRKPRDIAADIVSSASGQAATPSPFDAVTSRPTEAG